MIKSVAFSICVMENLPLGGIAKYDTQSRGAQFIDCFNIHLHYHYLNTVVSKDAT